MKHFLVAIALLPSSRHASHVVELENAPRTASDAESLIAQMELVYGSNALVTGWYDLNNEIGRNGRYSCFVSYRSQTIGGHGEGLVSLDLKEPVTDLRGLRRIEDYILARLKNEPNRVTKVNLTSYMPLVND